MSWFDKVIIQGITYFARDNEIQSLKTPANAGKLLRVNSSNNAIETVSPTAEWGSITGTLAAQTDLQSALDSKQSALPNASAAGKVLKSTNTTGGVEWGEAGGGNIDNVKSGGKDLTITDKRVEINKVLTSAQYNALTTAEKNNGTTYIVTDEDSLDDKIVQVTGTSTTQVMSQNAVTQALKPLISITQTTNQTITVTCNGTAHTSSFNADVGSTITAINVAAVAGYNAGTATVNGSSTYNLPITVTASTAIAASPATKATYTFTITQSTGQTITVTCAGTEHTSTFTANYGDTWTATLEAASGYTAGELSAESGTVTGNTEVHATPATPAGPPVWPNYETSTSGRKFGRHATLPGTVMQWNDNGTTRTTLILDAAYRTSKVLYSNYSTNLNLTTHQRTGYFSSTGSSVSLPTDPTQFTDTSLNTKAMATQDARSSTVATNEWMNSSYYGTNMAAAYYVRNTLATTSGVMTACDFPTINCLTRMFGDMSIIDRFDPTASGSDYALTNWGSFGYAWPSSWYGLVGSSYRCLRVSSNGEVSSGSRQNGSNAVFPVLEIG